MQNLLLNLVSIFCVSTTDAKIASVPPQYLIITADVFYDAILPLAEWKTKKGVPAKVVKLSTISNPIHPYQTPDSIYNYIHSYFGQSDPPPEYLLLVGDAEFMPAYGYGGTTGAPCDHMYSLHTGNDHLSDILIARLPAQTVNDCITMVQKLLEYECNPPMSVPESYRKATSFSMGWWVTLQGNINKCLRDLGYAQIDSLGDATRDTMISNRINDGRSIFYYLGHAGPCGFNISGFDCADARALTNRKILCPVVLVSNACHTAYFKYDCLGEAFLRQENGAIGYWGAITRSDFGPAGDTCTIAFYYGLKQGIYNFQKLCNFGKSYMCKYFDPNTDGITQKTMYSLTTLGDPELPIWTDIPCTLFVTHTGFAPLGSSNFKVTVKNNTTPLENALVCVMKGSEVYVSGYTTAAGEIILAITPATMGNLTITVTAHNFLPYIGYALVGGSGVSYIKDSLSDPAPEGNNNGDLNPGEQVNLFVTVKNYSQEQVTNATAELIIHNPLITMITGTQGLGDIPANVEVTNSLPFKFKLSESALDGQVLSCSLKVTSGISGWYSEFEIPIVGVPSINVIPPQLSFFYHIDTKNKGATIDTILYDNGTPSSGINFGLNSYYAVRFTPADPCSVIGCKIYLDDYYNNSIQIRIYDDNAGTPGTLIEIDTLTIGNSPQWYTFTFNSAYKDENDFWISVCGPTKLYYDAANSGRNKYSTNSGSTWNNFTTGDLLIRAIVNYYSNAGDSGEIWVKNIGTGMLNVNNITLKQSSTWITDLQPLNMNVNIGDSDAICVKIDTTGISTDIAYWDTVLISSNDPLHTLTNVPVKLLISTQSNIAPEITSIPDQCFLSGDSVKLQLDQYVADVEDPDAALVWNYTIVGDSVLVNIDADRVATIKTIVPWIGERSIIFRVTDTGGLSDEDTILVTVNPRSLTCIIYDTSGIFPDTIDIPIWLQGNPNGLGILSAYVSLNFNSTILTPIKVVKGEIVPGEWLIEDTLAAGEVKIGLSGATTSLSSAGKLAIVSFVVNAIAQNNDTTTIHFHGLQFNEGSIQVNSQDGIFTVKKGIYEISGEVTYYSNSIPVSGTDMILSSPTNTDTFTTPTNGNYAFVELECINYTVTPQKFNLQKESCIGAHDAALVFRHRLGIDTLNPDEQVAAEVSGNGIITAYDATLILKYSVGKIIHFDAGDWEFEPNNRVYAPLTSTKTDENYKAILYGDPSGNWGSKEEEIQPNMSIAMNDISCQVGDTVFLPMLIDMMPGNETDIVSCDLSIEFDSSVISVLGSTAGKLIPSEWLYESNILPGKIRIGLAGGKAIKEGGELLNLQIVAKSEAQVEAERKSRFGGAESQIRIAKAMLNETGIIVKNGKLSVKSKSPTEYKMAIRPVIANGKVTVLYQLPVSSEIRVDIYDIGGRLVNTLVHSKQGAGYYEIVWTPDNSGIYFCKFIANKFESIKKIVVVN